MSDTDKKPNSRVWSGILIGAIVATAAILGGWVWALLTVVFFVVASREMFGLMAAKQIYPSKAAVWIFSLTFYMFAMVGWERHFQIVVTLGIIFTFAWLLFRKHLASISDIGGTIMMFFYLGLLPAHFILIRRLGAEPDVPILLQPGLRYLFLILFIVSASDVFAYYGGKRFGKNPLSPQISPKKTVEGAIIGTIAATVIGAGIAAWFHLGWANGALMGILLSGVAQVGDLSESLLKRDAGIKDSGSLIPGHGGILDRTDSYIFSGAVGYYYISWFILHQGLAHELLGALPR